eukprot:TRINITY_DN2798_c0_g1_i2.p4 TRINITY_DN2798_c0_g1~~TRINITY_DN2798_c0_g1_i2.p4  ORF type:complete len:50 (-),score=13.81 TRINITY_DN2798_c0_g1_i2:206-355(-)
MIFMKYVRNIDTKSKEDAEDNEDFERDEIHTEQQIRAIFAKLNKSTPIT